jgi:hypothetical protein
LPTFLEKVYIFLPSLLALPTISRLTYVEGDDTDNMKYSMLYTLHKYRPHRPKLGDTLVKHRVTAQIVDKMSELITASFGLVAALAWNDTIKAIFAKVGTPDHIPTMLFYSIIVTLIAVVMTLWIGRVAGRLK